MKKITFILLAALAWTACNENKPIIGGGGDVDEHVYDNVTVLEYLPAPGQFINKFKECSTMKEACEWAESQFRKTAANSDKPNQQGLVSLGSFGGHIIVKLSADVANRDGYDFGIQGNAFDGSSEPGIVWVAEAVDGDEPVDIKWYELSGSDTPQRGYKVTYYRTEEPGDVRWTDNKGNEGIVAYLPQYHTQNYFPAWVGDESYTLTGSLLEPKAEKDKVTGQWYNAGYGYGYADNMGSDAAKNDRGVYQYNRFDISDAVDADGRKAGLKNIRYIKVQNAVLANLDNVGEISAEVLGFLVW